MLAWMASTTIGDYNDNVVSCLMEVAPPSLWTGVEKKMEVEAID